MKRVVVTGMGVVSPLGYGVDELVAGLASGACATRRIPEWDEYDSLHSKVAAPLELRGERDIPRRFRRTMSPMSVYAAQAATEALADAGVERESVGEDPRFGCVLGHTTGSPITISETYRLLGQSGDFGMLSSSDFFHCLSHTVALNVAQYLGIGGVVMATSAACASGLQAVGAGLDLIRLGRQDMMLCGGSEELHPTVTGSFDILFATSSNFNDAPERTPRPFDRDRDGLVCGEGAGVLLLEEYEHALRRGATIHGELVGYHTCGNGVHVSQSSADTMRLCMEEALRQAGLTPGDIDYVNAHATATEQGDAAEAEAVGGIFGDRVPVSSLKGNLGHTLGASGAIETIASLAMMRLERLFPTHNLDNVADDCAGIQHLTEPRDAGIRNFIKNSFAFGGINAALVVSHH